MSGWIGGAGLGIPQPASNYGYNPVGGTTDIDLPPGGVFHIPSGKWLVDPGQYSFLQLKDYTTGLWRTMGNSGSHTFYQVESDGQNYRLANLTGCAIGAVVTNGGSGYTSAPAIAPSAGNSVWRAIVGGAINTTVTIGTAGSGYTYPPMVAFSAPPAGGLPALGYATLSSGTVASIVVVQQGAGYTAAPTVTLFPNPADPNLANITPAAATCALAGSGAVTAVVCANHGSPATAIPTLAFSGGGGSAAAATAVMCLSVTGVTISGAGTTVVGAAVAIEFVSAGIVASAAYLQPRSTFFCPRRGIAEAPISGGQVGTAVVLDGGLFPAIPVPLLIQGSQAAPAAAPAATLAVGGNNDVAFLVQVG